MDNNPVEQNIEPGLSPDYLRKMLSAFMHGARSILELTSFHDSARAIFDYCREVTGAKSGYVALLNEHGDENEVLFLEDGGLECTVDPELPMPIRGLRAESYETGKAVFHNSFMESDWVKFMPEGHVYLKNVMFAPLMIEGQAIGLIGLANKDGDFNENDAQVAAVFGEMAAVALYNNRVHDKLAETEKNLTHKVEELNQALAEVKTLKGFIPICSYCRKIRNDKGYWDKLETYICEHSEAQLSHGICEECLAKYFPENT